ncbi:MAG: hypothetical protein OEV42_14750 [Deltaproteobacteria bacterium]|nr:hypothetical protein [Deltaproteobacteria bacterium]
MPEISFDDGIVKLSGIELPGILKRLSIRGRVQFDMAEADGASGKIKKFMGWDDSDISLTIELLTDEESDCYDKLLQINGLFKLTDNNTANPVLYTVTNRHCLAREINTVYFAGLNSDESDSDDVIVCMLNFIEDDPPVVPLEKQVIAAPDSTPVVSPSGDIKASETVLELDVD